MSVHVVAKLADVPEGSHIIVQARGRELGIFNVRGTLYALPNNCFHQNGPVCRGSVSGAIAAGPATGWKKVWTQEGEIVMCPWHSLEFNVTTGQCLAYPDKRLAVLPVRVDGDEIKVEL